MKTITVKNDFHRTAANIRAEKSESGTLLTRATVARVRRKLCGISECTCGGVLGQRGPQLKGWDFAAMDHGEVMVRYIGDSAE
jgi:hypothetical protein